MSNLRTIPDELLCEIVSNLCPLATLNLLRTCHSLPSRALPAMHLHDVAPKDNMPALHLAAKKGHLQLVQCLLTGCPVDLPDDFGNTLLHAAAQSCHVLVTETPVYGADVNRTGEDGVAPLAGASDGVKANSNTAKDIVQILSNTAQRSKVAGAAGILELLLDHGADVDTATYLGYTADCGLIHSVKVLVGSGANLNAEDMYGDSAIVHAAMSDHTHFLVFLMGCKGFDIHAEGLVYPIIPYGCDAALNILLQQRASPCRVDNLGGQSILPVAVLRRSKTAVRTVLQNGADTAGDYMSLTLLTLAIDMDNLPIVKIMLKYWTPDASADVFQRFMFTCGRGSKKIVELLLENGVEINMLDVDGLTVMTHAKIVGWSSVVARMASYGSH